MFFTKFVTVLFTASSVLSAAVTSPSSPEAESSSAASAAVSSPSVPEADSSAAASAGVSVGTSQDAINGASEVAAKLGNSNANDVLDKRGFGLITALAWKKWQWASSLSSKNICNVCGATTHAVSNGNQCGTCGNMVPNTCQTC